MGLGLRCHQGSGLTACSRAETPPGKEVGSLEGVAGGKCLGETSGVTLSLDLKEA